MERVKEIEPSSLCIHQFSIPEICPVALAIRLQIPGAWVWMEYSEDRAPMSKVRLPGQPNARLEARCGVSSVPICLPFWSYTEILPSAL